MLLFELENKSKYLYHVTFASNADNIKSKGLLQFQPSNWVKAGTGKRYNENAGIFAFDNPRDAVLWAFEMDWQFKEPVVVARIEMEDFWETDPSSDIRMARFGKAMQSSRNIPADKIIDIIDLSTPGDLGIMGDDWIDRSEEILRK
jgi:hypothetical protein